MKRATQNGEDILRDSYEMTLQAIQQLCDRSIAYNPAFAKMAGSVTAGVFLSQAAYWSLRPQIKERDGWFYKSAAEWESETCLTLSEQQTARKKLRSIGVLEEVRKGAPCTVHYRVNFSRILGILGDHQFTGNPQTGLRESYKLAYRNRASQYAGNPQTGLPESRKLLVPETTAQNTQEGTAAAQPVGAAPLSASTAPWPSEPPPDMPVSVTKSAKAKGDRGVTSEQARFIVDLWTPAYDAHFKGCHYSPNWGRDCKAIKWMLETAGKTPEELIEVAKSAWARMPEYPFDSATSIAGFANRLNDIQAKLPYAKNQTHLRPNPRNNGIAIGPTDYGEAAKRKLERQALEARNRELLEAQGT